MKYFEVAEPYYALIKAKNKDEMIEIYGQIDDDENFDFKEVDKDYAWEKFSNKDVTRDKDYTPEELETEFNTEEAALLLIDSTLI